MRTYNRNRICLIFSAVRGDQAVFRQIKAQEQANAEGIRFIALTGIFNQPEVPMNYQALSNAAVWEDFTDGDRMANKAPVLTRMEKQKAVEALQQERGIGNVISLESPAVKFA